MVRTVFKVLAADTVLLITLYYVIQDLQWRTSFAASPHASALHGYSPSFGYNLFTRIFTMSGGGLPLTSPPTLDWVQVLALVLVAINAWYAYVTLTRRRGATTSQTGRA
jgi:hypothetical protein